MKKQTKQSRQTARRKARQGRTWELFKRAAEKYNWQPKIPEELKFEQLDQIQKFACMRYYTEVAAGPSKRRRILEDKYAIGRTI